MHADHYFAIGTDHITAGTPCEDYALTGMTHSGAVFGVVADGCSGANANTDVGARAIAWAFKAALNEQVGEPGEWFGPGFTELLLDTFRQHQYQGNRLDYQSTVVAVVGTPEAASVYVHGDGAVALRYADGSVRLIQFSWWDNAPFYLNYKLYNDFLDQFLDRFADGVIEPLTMTSTTFRQGEGDLIVEAPVVERFAMSEAYDGHVLHFRPAEEGIVAIAVLTDGIEKVGAAPLAPVDVVNELMAFKNFEGSFVKRRAMRALKDFTEAGRRPRDDLAIATVLFPVKA
jgi:hypothetical protein